MKYFLVLMLLAGTAASAQQLALLPNSMLTPGAADPTMTADKLCAKGFTTRSTRDVTEAEKLEVYRRYDIPGPHQGYCSVKEGCEVDHLISLEIGGSNDVKNLWPQPYSGTVWNAHTKDRLENFLHRAVCTGKESLADAQHGIALNWIAEYKRHPELAQPVK